MSRVNLFVLKTLLLLWVFCAVVCEHQKRDVHRIIIKQKIPKGQKKGHHSHHHSHGHKRSHSHRHSSFGTGHGRKNKGKKHRGSVEEDVSSDESSGSLSRENSFEDVFHNYKTQDSYHHKKTLHNRSPSSREYEVNKQEPYKDNSELHYEGGWIPLSSEQIHQSSREVYREKGQRRKNGKNKDTYADSLKPPPVEITTSYPFQFDSSSIYPQLSSYSNALLTNNFNKKDVKTNKSLLAEIVEESQHSELNTKSGRLKNHKTNYEVEELTPAASNVQTFMSVLDDSKLIISKEQLDPKNRVIEMEEARSTRKPSRFRGRSNYRGNNKF